MIVCTGQSSVAQRVRGLRLGADDWVTKPCHPEELIARIEAVVRRRKRADVRVETGAGRRSARSRSAPTSSRPSCAARSVELTRREYELIQLLAEAEGQVLQREEIYQRVWGYAMVHGDRSVDVFVRKLRSKLERVSPGWRYIHTHFGIGYRFAAEPVEAPVGEPRARCPSPSRVGSRPSRSSSGALELVSGWVRTATSTCATSRSSSRSRSPSGSSRAAAPPRRRSRTSSRSRSSAGLFFLGYRIYMERRVTIFGLEERQRGLLYGALALAVFAIVATSRMWDAGGLGALLWLAMLGAAGWALYSVWRAYQHVLVSAHFCNKAV